MIGNTLKGVLLLCTLGVVMVDTTDTTVDDSLHLIEPRKNLWVTWANQTRTSAFCLALASATDPFRTCLIGIPGFDNTSFAKYSTNNCSKAVNVSHCTALLLSGLNTSLPWDPQELDLLGSRVLNANSNETGCVSFGSPTAIVNSNRLTPHTAVFANVSVQCGQHASYGWGNGQVRIWANKSALALPPSVFLICGDRAWQGVPKGAHGGPCYLGKLTLLAMNKTIAANLMRFRKRRSLKLNKDCKDEVKLWNPTARVFASILPHVGTAHALKTLGKLACWVSKQSNVTTEIIRELSTDMDSLRHSILQNRAAIDFLLLAQGHGCDEFEGMCCFNLSNHGESIHKQLQWLKEHTAKIVMQDDNGLFGIPWSSWGITGWLRYIMQIGLVILLVFVGIAVILPCALQCLKKSLSQTMNQLWLAQTRKENGGNVVETWLIERGHIDLRNLSFNNSSIQ